MRTLPSLLSLALLALSLAACGNKGPLVLPSPDESEMVPGDEVAPDPAEDAADDATAGDTDDAGDEGDPGTPAAGAPGGSGR